MDKSENLEQALPAIGSMWVDPKSDPVRLFRVTSYGFGKYVALEALNRQPRQRIQGSLSLSSFKRKLKPYLEG